MSYGINAKQAQLIMSLGIKQHIQHSWNLQPQEASALQKKLSDNVNRSSGLTLSKIRTVAGIDTHYDKGLATAAVVTTNFLNLDTVEIAIATKEISYPYIPGLLSFREGPAILDALEKLKRRPDLLIFDGQGIAHPRRFGIASHIGLLVDIPSIGCAKTRLAGQYEEPDTEKGNYSYLEEHGEIIGAVVRTRSNVKPLFISIGHRMNLQDSIDVILKYSLRYRLPEPSAWRTRTRVS